MELMEKVAFGKGGEKDWKCPFDHEEEELEDRESEMEDWEESSSGKLRTSLKEKKFNDGIPITVKRKKHIVKFNPHHLIPGVKTWCPKGVGHKLRKWVDHRDDHIKKHIGYKVNDKKNGFHLPSGHGIPAEGGGLWSDFSARESYAFEAMNRSPETRQFHDAHNPYSNWVSKALLKIYEKMQQRITDTEYPGCDEENCAGNKRKKKPYDPPLDLEPRLEGVATRLKSKLKGNPKRWQTPLFTSNFARLYHLKMKSS